MAIICYTETELIYEEQISCKPMVAVSGRGRQHSFCTKSNVMPPIPGTAIIRYTETGLVHKGQIYHINLWWPFLVGADSTASAPKVM